MQAKKKYLQPLKKNHRMVYIVDFTYSGLLIFLMFLDLYIKYIIHQSISLKKPINHLDRLTTLLDRGTEKVLC